MQKKAAEPAMSTRKQRNGTAPESEDSRYGRTVHSHVVKLIGDLMIYLAVAILLLGAVRLRSALGSAPVNIAGYSGMLVLSGSMQDVLPEGSLILTKWVEPETLKVGDDITFLADSDFCVTHRIIGIRTLDDGSLAFQTKGVNNPTPDSGLAVEDSIVGKVVYHDLTAGRIVIWIRANWPLVMLAGAVMTAIGDAASCGRSVKAAKRKRI